MFDLEPHLGGPTLALSPLRSGDFDGLQAAAARPEVWAGHPVKNRDDRNVFQDCVQSLLRRGGTWRSARPSVGPPGEARRL